MSVEAEQDAAMRIAAALEDTESPPEVVSIFETGPGRAEVSAQYPYEPNVCALRGLILAAADGAPIDNLRIDEVPDADWVTISQGKRGRVIAGRFIVHGSHERLPRKRGAIEIDASRAFGTAHHASTRGCLMLLDGLLRRERPRRVLDIGTGTGVLAIAAAQFLPGADVLATDNDPIAVAIGAENARLNGVPAIRFAVAEGFDLPCLRGAEADLVFGNLLKSILFELTPGFARHTRPGGAAILSGLTDAQSASVEARFGAFGFRLEKRIRLDGWTSLLMRKTSASPAAMRRQALFD